MWKYAVPKEKISGEFDNHDPMGLIAGALIPTDCSINLQTADAKIYCFASGTSLVFFQNMQNTNISHAREAWKRFAHE